MGDKFLKKKDQIRLVVFLIICLTVLTVVYFRKENAQSLLEKYNISKDCPTIDNCRKRVMAEILESNSLTLDLAGGKGSPLRETSYTLLISSRQTGTMQVKIFANAAVDGATFDLPNVTVLDSNTNFAKANFYPNRIVFIELWRNQVTFIFLDSIIEAEGSSEVTDAAQTIVPSSLKEYDLAFPTSSHPVFVRSNSRRDFYGVFVVVLGIILLVGSLMATRKDTKGRQEDDSPGRNVYEQPN